MIARIVAFVITYVVRFFWSEAESWLSEYTEKKKIEAINEENLRRYNEALHNNMPDSERQRRAHDLINGVDTRPK